MRYRRGVSAKKERLDRHRPAMGQPGWFPDHASERREDFSRTTPSERVAEAIRLSELATRIAAAAAAQRG